MPATALRAFVRNIPTVAPVPNRAVLSLSGSQASEFLNGVVATLMHDPPKGPLYSAFLNAQGRVLYDAFLYTSTECTGKRNYLLDYDSRRSEAPPLLSLLKRYILRSKVKIQDVSDEYNVWAAWGASIPEPPRNWSWARSDVIEPKWGSIAEWPWGTQDKCILDRRAPGMGKRFLIRKGALPQETSDHDMASSVEYTLHRILRGVPEGFDDISPLKTFPMEVNLDIMGGCEVDFHKGCYVGQEQTVRTYHTGVVRKRILPVLIHKAGEPVPEVAMPSPHAPTYPFNVDIRPIGNSIPRMQKAGRLLTSCQGVGLAMLRLNHVEAAERGELELSIDGEGVDKGEWRLSHWWPDWWPRRQESQ